MKAYPGVVAGLKDSMADLDRTLSLVRAFPDLAILAGYDDGLLPVLEAGGAGCITACANVASSLAAEVIRALPDLNSAQQAQVRLTKVRRTLEVFPMIAALKEIMARHSGRDSWRNLRPPMVTMDKDKADEMMAQLDGIGFALPRAS